MSLSPNQAFKAGFLARCVEDRLSLPEIQEAAEKAAAVLEKQGFGLDDITGGAKYLGERLLGYGLPIALAAPPLAGTAVGYLAGKATDASDTDVEAIKNKEVLDEYRRQTAKLRRLRAAAGR